MDYIYKNGPKPLVNTVNGPSDTCPSFQTDFQQIQFFRINGSNIYGTPAPPYVLNQKVPMSGAGIVIPLTNIFQAFTTAAGTVGPNQAIFVIHFNTVSATEFINYAAPNWDGVSSSNVVLPQGIIVASSFTQVPGITTLFDKPFDFFYVSYSTVDLTNVTGFVPVDFVIGVTPCNATPISV